MHLPIDQKQEVIGRLNELKHLKFKENNDEYVVALVDATGFEIIRGFGPTATEALNDLHGCLL